MLFLVLLVCLPFLHHCHGAHMELIRRNMTFHDAGNFCVSIRARLASIHSNAENQQVYALCKNAGQNCWIGLERRGSSFAWVDGTPFTFSNFMSGEPDNWHGVESCGMMKIDDKYHGAWSDQACEEPYDKSYFVCKYPSSHTTPSATTTPTASTKTTASTKINNHFLLVQQKLTFHNAESYCNNKGGHLTSIQSLAEQKQVYDLCRKVNQNCWIGFENKNSNGFTWTDSSPVIYMNFQQGEPDNWNGVESCIMMKVNNQYHGTWSDQNCDADYDKSYFVCKIPNGAVTTPAITPTIPMVPSTTHDAGVTIMSTQSHIIPNDHKLRISGDNFVFGGRRVFLSGINKAWEAYAYDFGQAQYQYRRRAYQKVFQEIEQAGGNSVRIWIHIEGETSPQFDSSGHVISTDEKGTLISDLRTMIHDAQQHNLFVFPCLWNAAVKQNFHQRLDGLIKDTSKLQSYIDNALIPMVKALKNETALGGWDIMNEPGGEMIQNVFSSDPCQDTRFLDNSGAGWAGPLYKAAEFQRFVNWQADAIKRTDPDALVTLGTWSGRPNMDKFGWRNLYKDSCLVHAGGRLMGTLSFYQIHSYSWQGKFSSDSPFLHDFSELGLGKPVVIGEFREREGAGMTINQLYDHAYLHGYAGAWGWSEKDGNMQNLMQGMGHIKNYNDQSKGGIIRVAI